MSILRGLFDAISSATAAEAARMAQQHVSRAHEQFIYTMATDGMTEKHMIGAVSFVKRDGVWEMPK